MIPRPGVLSRSFLLSLVVGTPWAGLQTEPKTIGERP